MTHHNGPTDACCAACQAMRTRFKSSELLLMGMLLMLCLLVLIVVGPNLPFLTNIPANDREPQQQGLLAYEQVTMLSKYLSEGLERLHENLTLLESFSKSALIQNQQLQHNLTGTKEILNRESLLL